MKVSTDLPGSCHTSSVAAASWVSADLPCAGRDVRTPDRCSRRGRRLRNLKADSMTNSATSTDRRQADTRGSFHYWHFFLLLAMAGATVAVVVSRETHPAALLLLSAAVICAG